MTWRRLPGGEEWLLRPAKAGMCRYESLIDGTLNLADIALMNDMIACDADNEALARQAAERARG